MGMIFSGLGNIIDDGVILLGDVCDVNGGMFNGSIEIGGIMFILVNCL